MTEIHAFDPDGTASPGAQAALDAVANEASQELHALAGSADERTMLNRVKVRAVLDYRDTNDVYPQAFAYNPDEGHWYLGAQPSSAGGAVFYRLYRIDASTGERVDYCLCEMKMFV